MPFISGTFDSGYIQPLVKVGENISIFSTRMWNHFRVDYMEPIPAGPASQVEAITASGATNIAANGTIAKRLVTILQLADLEFLHVRWCPLDDVEGLIWELSGQQKFATRNIHSRCDLRTKMYDPTLASTTFFILGQQRDMNLEVRNPTGYIQYLARFQFMGIRYLLTDLVNGFSSNDVQLLHRFDEPTVKRLIGNTTRVYAEGVQS